VLIGGAGWQGGRTKPAGSVQSILIYFDVVVEFLGMVFRYFELGVYASLLLLTGLLYLKTRPPGLVWVSALAMGALVAHLYVEQGRWQLIPVYVLTFAFSIAIASPTRKPYRAGGLIVRFALTILLVIPSFLLSLAVPIFVIPQPSGPNGVGTVRLAFPDSAPVIARYPAIPPEEPLVAPYWTAAEVRAHRLPGLPKLFSSHLTLVPTNSVLRAPKIDGRLPVALVFSSDDSLPSDYITTLEQAASLGWFVVEIPAAATPEQILGFLDALNRGAVDTAFVGTIDTSRVVAVGLGRATPAGLGVRSISIGAGSLFSVAAAGATYGMDLPDASIPALAMTGRHRIIRPSRLLLGSSDVPPGDLVRIVTGALSAALGSGTLSDPVFAGTAADALGEFRRALVDGPSGLSIIPRSGPR